MRRIILLVFLTACTCQIDGGTEQEIPAVANAKAPIQITMDAFVISHNLPFCYNPITRGQFRDVKLLYRLAGNKDWNTVEGIRSPRDATHERYEFIISPLLTTGTIEVRFSYIFDGVQRERAGENTILLVN